MEKENSTLSLPKIPKDAYYEDYVAALLNAGGYYIERNIHKNSDGLDLLEIDVVATRFSKNGKEQTIVEIKSGGWGISDIFKVNGWLNYLSLKKAAFIVQEAKARTNIGIIREAADKLNVTLIENKKIENGKLDDQEIIKELGLNIGKHQQAIINSLRYSYNLERIMLQLIIEYSKDNERYKSLPRVINYFRNLVDESFFENNPIRRLIFLSNLYVENENIAAITDHEIYDKDFKEDEEYSTFTNYFSLFFPKDMKFNPVDVAQYSATLNRLYVIKAIVDYSLLQPEDNNLYQKTLDELLKSSLFRNISDGIDWVKQQKNYTLYPYFWQIFIFVFGGFFLLDKKEEEYEYLSNLTGIPTDEIGTALEFWEKLFPIEKDWLHTVSDKSYIYELKMIPAPVRGIGVNFRLHLYASENMKTIEERFDNIKNILTGFYTYGDIVGWNNQTYELLRRDNLLHSPQKVAFADSKFERRQKEVYTYIQTQEYDDIKSLEEFIKTKNKKTIGIPGYIAQRSEKYDIYLIKSDVKNDKLPFVQVIKDSGLNVNKINYFFILGTDETKEKGDDAIWFMTKVEAANLAKFADVISEFDKIKNN